MIFSVDDIVTILRPVMLPDGRSGIEDLGDCFCRITTKESPNGITHEGQAILMQPISPGGLIVSAHHVFFVSAVNKDAIGLRIIK